MPLRRLAQLAPALVLAALALPGSAFGQATRTYVSGVGDDANPCSRTAPCKTFAGAISKTANGGEINCLDPAGYGALTIQHSLTIKCQYTEGGVLVSGTNGIVVNAGANDKVTLRGLDFNGAPFGTAQSLAGVKVISARQVNVVDSEIWGFQVGVDVNPTSPSTGVVIAHSHIHQNGVGVFNAPGNNVINFTSVVMRDDDVQDNTCAVANSSFGANSSTPDPNTDCGTATSASGINKAAIMGVYHSGLNLNGIGLLSRGSSSNAEIAYDDITGNSAFGLHRLDTGHIKTFTPATNVVSNNAASDAPDQTGSLTRRARRRAGR